MTETHGPPAIEAPAIGAREPDAPISEYSTHYARLTEETAATTASTLERPMEGLRTELDLRLIRRFAKGPRILDFPIGAARIFPHLIGEFELHGYDISEAFLSRARADYPDLADRFQWASFEDIPYPETFDTVLTFRTLNNISDKDLAVRNTSAILEPDGRWLLVVPAGLEAETVRLTEQRGLRLLARVNYDYHATVAGRGRRAQAVHRHAVRAIVALPASRTIYRAYDSVMSTLLGGTRFLAFEKSV